MRFEPELSACSIVLVGDFNPAIFHPAWFKARNIYPGADDVIEDVRLVHRDIAAFSIEADSYHVEKERFAIETTSAPRIRIADTTRRILTSI